MGQRSLPLHPHKSSGQPHSQDSSSEVTARFRFSCTRNHIECTSLSIANAIGSHPACFPRPDPTRLAIRSFPSLFLPPSSAFEWVYFILASSDIIESCRERQGSDVAASKLRQRRRGFFLTYHLIFRRQGRFKCKRHSRNMARRLNHRHCGLGNWDIHGCSHLSSEPKECPAAQLWATAASRSFSILKALSLPPQTASNGNRI